MNAEDAEAREVSRAEWADAIPPGVFVGFAWGFSLVFSGLTSVVRNAYIANIGINVLGFGTSTGAFWVSTGIAAVGTTAFVLHLRWRAARGFPWSARASAFAVGTAVGIALLVLVAALPVDPGL